jgi:hypothetical protein
MIRTFLVGIIILCIGFQSCQVNQDYRKEIKENKGKQEINEPRDEEIEYLIYGLGDPMYEEIVILKHPGVNMAFERLLEKGKDIPIARLIKSLNDDRKLTGIDAASQVINEWGRLRSYAGKYFGMPLKKHQRKIEIRVSDAIDYILREKTDQFFDFCSAYGEEDRENAIKAWENWWNENHDYLYWNEKYKLFEIDKEAKKAGTPTKEYRKIHPWSKEEKTD